MSHRRIAQLAPTVAYDRSGLGKSDWDGEAPTVQHVASNLRALLTAAQIPPPYVLAGHSWGAIFARAFAVQYPSDVVGLVFLEATDYERTCDEMKTIVPLSKMAPGPRAHLEQVSRYFASGWEEVRGLRISGDLPVAVLVGGKPDSPLPPDALTTNVHIWRLLQIRHQAEWALSSRAGLLLSSSQAGHMVLDVHRSWCCKRFDTSWTMPRRRGNSAARVGLEARAEAAIALLTSGAAP